jgi:hypothetical protein
MHPTWDAWLAALDAPTRSLAASLRACAGVLGDEIAAGPVRCGIHPKCRVEVGHALTVVVHEREPFTGVTAVVGVDADTEPGPLVPPPPTGR